MISHELARKLKDAGFPQSELARAQQQAGYDYVSLPTFSTLIEGCGEGFGALGTRSLIAGWHVNTSLSAVNGTMLTRVKPPKMQWRCSGSRSTRQRTPEPKCISLPQVTGRPPRAQPPVCRAATKSKRRPNRRPPLSSLETNSAQSQFTQVYPTHTGAEQVVVNRPTCTLR